MTIGATDLMRKEWEYMNQFSRLNETAALISKANLSTYGLFDKASVFGASSALQKHIESMGSYKFIQDSIARKATLGLAGYDFGHRSALSQVGIGRIAQKAFESMNSLNVIKDSLALHKLRQFDSLSNIQKMMGTSLIGSMQKSMESVVGLAHIRESISAKALAGLRTHEDMIKTLGINTSLTLAQKASVSLLGLNSIQEAVGFRTSAIQQAMKTMQHMKLFEAPESITKTIGQLQSSGMFSKTIEALNRDNVFAQAMESFNVSGYSGQFAYDISDYELSENIALIENSGEDNFLDIFIKLHPNTKAIILFIFLQIFMPQFNNICSNLMMPSIERAIGSGKLNTDQVRAIKKTPLQDIDTENVRFITRNDVKVRTKPNTHSEVLDVLVIGQVFQVVNTKRGWAKIVYSCDDEQMCRGWVLTTYTSKFKR